MKTACVYHSIDLDGWMSAAIVKHWFVTKHGKDCMEYRYNPETTITEAIYKGAFETLKLEYPAITFIGYNYGQPIPDLAEYDKVIMCDISFPKDEMFKLFNRLDNKFIWIDHHISAIKECGQLDEYGIVDISTIFNGLRRTDNAACELTWNYFFPGYRMPDIVRLLGMYDCFSSRGTDEEQKVLEFQYGARSYIKNYEDAYIYLIKTVSDDLNSKMSLAFIQTVGESIYKFLCTDAISSYKNGFKVRFDIPELSGYPENGGKGYNFICINKERFNPINFGIKYHEDGYDGAACFHYANEMYNFSLYNDNGLVDCSVIAKQYGDGGHAGASGFRLNHEQFNKLLNL